MFTGIVEEEGTVNEIISGTNSIRLKVSCKKVLEDGMIGDSIAVNGVCLTVTERTNNSFVADVMHETIDKSSLGKAKVGSKVNLERAMAANGRFGGHIVSGHIDGTGVVDTITKDDNAIWFKILAPKEILRYIVLKGSVCLDGISLTVAKVKEDSFYVSIIPHTIKETILRYKQKGDIINIENDQIGKYVEKLLIPITNNKSNITEEFLRSNGF